MAIVYVRKLLQVRNEVQTLRAHHFLVSRPKLKPWVSQDVLDLWSFVRVLQEDLLKQGAGLSGHMVGDRQFLLANVLIQFFVILAFEGKPATQQSVQ